MLRARTWVGIITMGPELWAVFQATAGWKYPGIRPFDLYPQFEMGLAHL